MNTLMPLGNKVNQTVKNVVNNTAKVANNTVNVVGNAANNTVNAVGNAAGTTVNAVGNMVGNTINAVGNVADSTVNAVGNVAGSTVNAFKNAAGSTVNAFKNAAGSTVNAFKNVTNGKNSGAGFKNSFPSISYTTIAIITLLTVLSILLFVYFDKVQNALNSLRTMFQEPVPPPPPPPPPLPGSEEPEEKSEVTSSDIFTKILPGSKEVYNVSSNRYTFYDAEPLCKALGAELATYEQVKEAWAKGADWCNYGWVKGQQALYPTQKDTYEKLQLAPEGDRLKCGQPGLNGGFFDNPEERFGVNCYGPKPAQSLHDATLIEQGAPSSPDVIEFNKKVNRFKSDSDNLGIIPFNSTTW
jgi:hypothetical protein